MVGFWYNITRYLFSKIIQGDIVSLLNEDGTLVATYVYDAYGNHKVYGNNGQENTEASFVGNINPFRYRGYYYDVETKLYYLNSRYYDPEVGRFISPDILSILDETMMEANGLNLYMYCGNNPVMKFDSNGTSWSSFWNNIGNWFQNHWKEIAIETAFIIVGALVTALTCGAGTTFWVAFGGALLSSAIQVGTGMVVGVTVNGLVNISNGQRFFDNVGDTLASSFMWGGIFSGGAQMLDGGLRWAKEVFKFKGIDTKFFGLMSPDKLWYNKAGATIFRIGTRNGVKLAIDLGRYGIHAHIISSAHLWVIPVLVGLIEYFRERQ